ncbi:hypothetical protein [Rivularia sp. UHCC 0363]|uniref:hypothetical protein n=1 Tax=Rivularia sp. UHCC 0363 TaxID=3110244 RepID=UPI002B2134EB|nr:hypothetical protein [Rivularia sp. UHCC 0363]MEA5598747.1 hypothetical protein [Rivularia sp. UHCC 0363]
MKSLFNYLREMSTARSPKQKIKKKSLASLALILCTWGYTTAPAQAEGSRNLYPQGATGSRANTEWRKSNSYGPTTPVNNSLLRRTLLQVYAKSGEYILLGSSAVGVGQGDILIYGSKFGRVGDESLSDLRFQCTQQRTNTNNTNQGKITSRSQELAGPDTITNEANATPGKQVTNGYVPCYYKALSDGIYYVVFYGPSGGNSDVDPSNTDITGEINLSGSNNFNAQQKTSVAAWDVTVRSSLTSTTDINGRLFTDYLALFTGNNGRPMNSIFYTVTNDGYRYKTDLNGLDPNGFVIYGNDIGYYDRDGKSPLYRNVLGNNGNLTTLEGDTNFALPTHVIFFSNPQTNAEADNAIIARGIPLIPTAPIVNNLSYAGTAGSNNSKQNTGGDFTFQSNVAGIYEIVISRNGNNVDPTNTQNRVLRGKMTSGGTQIVKWDGKDNDGNYFPLGTNYPVRIRIHAGEYHFPLIDAENSTNGGPSFTLLNAANPLGNTVGFYDDRGYRTLPKDGEAKGVLVGTQGSVLCGLQPPSIPNSNPVNGFVSTSAQRAFGADPGVNKNKSCEGSFGDAKGLDVWTFFPSEFVTTSLNIVAITNNPKILLVKRITAINGDRNKNPNPNENTPLNQFVDDTVSTHKDDDNHPYWANNYLIGAINGGKVKPNDELEYTIYYLSAGSTPAKNVLFCDRVPENVTFIPNSFNNQAQATGGLQSADRGILWLKNGLTESLTNVADGDVAQYFPPSTEPSTIYPNIDCGGLNTNGAVVVDLKDLPSATGSGEPNTSYGLVRFRGRVK